MLAGQAGDEIGRDLRRVAERLVVDRGQPGYDRPGLLRPDVQLGVVGTQVSRNSSSVLRLVVVRLVEADGEGADRPFALGLHQRHDQRGIDAAGKEGAERHVGDHLLADRSPEPALQRLNGRFLRSRERISQPLPDDLGHVPVGGHRLQAIRPDAHDGRRLDLPDAGVDRMRCRDVVVAEIERQRVAVDRALPPRMGLETLQLRSEEKQLAHPAEVERLLADPVPDQVERPLGAVPQREGEHPGHRLHRRHQAPPLDGGQHHLGVRVTAPAGPMGLLLLPELLPVVDLAIEHDDVPAAGRQHRLVAFGREVENRQPPVPQRDAGFSVEPAAGVIRPAVPDGLGHPPQCRRGVLDTEGGAPEPRDAAHQAAPR